MSVGPQFDGFFNCSDRACPGCTVGSDYRKVGLNSRKCTVADTLGYVYEVTRTSMGIFKKAELGAHVRLSSLRRSHDHSQCSSLLTTSAQTSFNPFLSHASYSHIVHHSLLSAMASTSAVELKQKGNELFKAGQLARCVGAIYCDRDRLMWSTSLIASAVGLSIFTPR